MLYGGKNDKDISQKWGWNYTKIKPKWVKNLDIKLKTRKLLEENIKGK